MNIGELKEMIKNLDDNVLIVSSISVEQGRGVSGGVDECVDMEFMKKSTFTRSISDDDTDSDWTSVDNDDNEEKCTNTVDIFLITSGCEEEWSQ